MVSGSSTMPARSSRSTPTSERDRPRPVAGRGRRVGGRCPVKPGMLSVPCRRAGRVPHGSLSCGIGWEDRAPKTTRRKSSGRGVCIPPVLVEDLGRDGPDRGAAMPRLDPAIQPLAERQGARAAGPRGGSRSARRKGRGIALTDRFGGSEWREGAPSAPPPVRAEGRPPGHLIPCRPGRALCARPAGAAANALDGDARVRAWS
jgi:hypothetical protein